MCGIIGVAGTLGKREEDIFKELLVIDSIRGEDSTGTAFINRINEVSLAKSVGDPFQLFDTKVFQSGLRQANKCLIGHNRSATVGKVTRKNAHPFEFPSVVGVHNGTLRSKYSLTDHTHYETDSEALYFNIDKYGLKPVIDKVDGAYTLVWYNKEEDSINFLRNKERPLFVAFTEDRKAVFWASERWMLWGPIQRRDVKMAEIKELPEDEHWSLSLPIVGKEFEEPVKQEVKSGFFSKGTSTGSPTTTSCNTPSGNKFGRIIHLPSSVPAVETLKGKETIIRPICWNKNSKGAYVIDALSHEFPMKKFKIYAHDEAECKGVLAVKRWHAVIGGQDKFNSNCYKINILSLSKVGEKANGNSRDGNGIIIPVIKTFKKDHMGHMIDKQEFEERYQECSFCGGNIEFEKEWKAFNHDACICDVCLADKEIVDYLPSIFSH